MWKVQLFKLNFDEREVNAVADVVSSGWITMGEKSKGFEAQFGDFLGEGAKTAAVLNGTAALDMALLALGIGAGDESNYPFWNLRCRHQYRDFVVVTQCWQIALLLMIGILMQPKLNVKSPKNQGGNDCPLCWISL